MQLAMTLHTGYDYFLSLPIDELIEFCADVNEINREAQREAKRQRKG